MSEQTLQIVQLLKNRLDVAISRTTLAEVILGLVVAIALLTSLWLIGIGAEAGLWLDVALRSVLFWALLAASMGIVVVLVLVPGLRHLGVLPRPTYAVVARRIGARYPQVSDRLVNLLELTEGHRSAAPDPLVDGAVRMLGNQIEGVPFEQVEQFDRARRSGRYAVWPVVGLVVFAVSAPGPFLGAVERLASPGTFFARPGPFQFDVRPGDTELIRGSSLEVTVRTPGSRHPETVVLSWIPEGETEPEEVLLASDSLGMFSHTLFDVRRSLKYRLTAETVESDWYEATVIERPEVRGLQVSLAYPAYTGLPPQQLEPNVGNVSALPGTRVTVEVALARPDAERVELLFDDGTRLGLVVDDMHAGGTFILKRSGHYQTLITNGKGVSNADPITHALAVVEDLPPSIALISPEETTALTDRMDADIRARFTDDFGFSGLALFYRLAESRFDTPSETFSRIPLPPASPRLLDQEQSYRWLLGSTTNLDPVPGDVIEYYVQVWDNDVVSGPKSARSTLHRLVVPSLAEQYEQLSEEQDAAETLVEELLQSTETVRDEFEQLRDELRRKQDGNWEDQRQLEQLQERSRRMEEQVEDLAQRVEEMTARMEENNLVSEETLEAFRELQRVVEEINSPELREALQQLQEAMQQLDLQKLQDSMGDFEFNEQQYKQRLERTLDLLKKLRLQQNLDEAARRLEELAEREERMANETEKLIEREKNDSGKEGARSPDDPQRPEAGQPNPETRSAEKLASDQDQARQELEQLQQKIEEMSRNAAEMKSGPTKQMEQLGREMQEQSMPEQMKENSRQLRNDEFREARQGQQNLQQQLMQMQQRLSRMSQEMQQGGKQMNMAGLRRALDNVLTLSRQQESLRRQVEGLASETSALRPFSQRQVELSEDLAVVSDTLQRLSRNIPEMSREVQRYAGEALREMSAATSSMADQVAVQAGAHQKGAMMHLNELALLLSNLLNSMMSGQSGGGMSMDQMMQQMQQMAGEQQQLNQQIQQMLNDMQGNRLSMDAQARMQQLARQQEEIRRQLKQVGRDPSARGKLLGDLNKIADQMEETIQEMQRSQADRRTIERQRQILTRLLDAQKSLQERGEEKKRKGQSGADIPRESPGDLSPEEEADRLRRDLIRALESGYAPDYQEIIKRYFELLQRQRTGSAP